MTPRTLLLAVALVVGLVPLSGVASADLPASEIGYVTVADKTADEAELHYKVVFPDRTKFGNGPWPAVIDYSGYVPGITIYDGLAERFTAMGYAVVGLNIRGSACSSGTFDYFERRQALDGVQAIAKLAGKPWSNGSFGMVGKSYPGITQLFVAGARPVNRVSPLVPVAEPGETWTQDQIDAVLAKHLKAIVPGHVFGDLYRDVPYPGGILNATFAGGWSAQRAYEGYVAGPQTYAEDRGKTTRRADEKCLANQAGHAANPPFNPFVQALQPQNNFDNEFFQERSPFWFAEQIETPTFLVESWQDEQVGSRATHLLERLKNAPWKYLATNGDHGEYYGPDVLPHIERFLSYYLKGEVPAADRRTVTEQRTVVEPELLPNGKPHPVKTTTRTETVTRPETYAEALARYAAEDDVIINWENGAGRRSRWTTTHATWPVPELKADTLYATPKGELTPAKPSDSGSVTYTYAPEIGSQERGGYALAQGQPPAAKWSDRPADGTSVSFTTAPLATDKVLLGSASVDLTLASTAVDTDLEVTMTELRPDGKEVFVQQGWLRASHRAEDTRFSTPTRPFQKHDAQSTTPLVPGVPTAMRVEIFPFGHVFRAGSKLRVTVAAPHVYPDLWGFGALPTVARNTILTGGATPSKVVLPLVDGATAGVRELPACGNDTMGVLRNQPCRTEPFGS